MAESGGKPKSWSFFRGRPGEPEPHRGTEVGIEDPVPPPRPAASGSGDSYGRPWWEQNTGETTSRPRVGGREAEEPDSGWPPGVAPTTTARQAPRRVVEEPPEQVEKAEPPPEIEAFAPAKPRTLAEAGLEPTLIEQIILRMLLSAGSMAGRELSRAVCLSKAIVGPLLDGMRRQTLVQHRGSDALGDFAWQLTDLGRARALEMRKLSLYEGPAPVPLKQYLDGVKRQTVTEVHPGPADLDRAFSDLIIGDAVRARIGPALASGKGLFLYGPPGNGKTSIAERIIAAYGGTIWIPYTLIVDGVIINLFDPATHKLADPADEAGEHRFDRRWVRIRRPTVVAGGELTLDMLDIKLNEITQVCEAPLQLRANCGSLVIDDFGRQVVEPNRLLNRWIVPLERRVDYLRMPNARKLRMPFDVVLIFSTNMNPRELVDEAFLRRIPYKVHIPDPTEREMRGLLVRTAREMRLEVPDPAVWDWLIDTWYRKPGRPMRFCHPRDLMLQVLNIGRYQSRPGLVTRETLDWGCEMYFAGM